MLKGYVTLAGILKKHSMKAFLILEKNVWTHRTYLVSFLNFFASKNIALFQIYTYVCLIEWQPTR